MFLLLTLLNRASLYWGISSHLRLSIWDILHVCLVGCIRLRDSVQLHKCLLRNYYWLEARDIMVTQITPSRQTAYSPREGFVLGHIFAQAYETGDHISLTWITQCQLIPGFGPESETCPHLLPEFPVTVVGILRVHLRRILLIPFILSRCKHMSQEVWSLSWQPPPAVELVSTLETCVTRG